VASQRVLLYDSGLAFSMFMLVKFCVEKKKVEAVLRSHRRHFQTKQLSVGQHSKFVWPTWTWEKSVRLPSHKTIEITYKIGEFAK